MTKKELDRRSKETVELFGQQIPMYADCSRCGNKLVCRFYKDIGYVQPCDECKKKPEYYHEYKQSLEEKAKSERMAYAAENKQLGGIFESNDGKWEILVSKKGNIIKQEKKRPRQLGKPVKKRQYFLPNK